MIESVYTAFDKQLESLWSLFPSLKPKSPEKVCELRRCIMEKESLEVDGVDDTIEQLRVESTELPPEFKIDLSVRPLVKRIRLANKRIHKTSEVMDMLVDDFSPFEAVTLDEFRQADIPEITGPKYPFKFLVNGGAIWKSKSSRLLKNYLEQTN